MSTETCCPEIDSIRALLSETCSEDKLESLVEHLDTCEQCQAEVDADVGGLSDLLATLHGADLDDTAVEPALSTVVDELVHYDPSQTTQLERTELLLDFRASFPDAKNLGRVGPYEILEEIGHGGMGVVLKGYDSKLRRAVSIKLIASRFSDESNARKRFYREARAAAAIKNPHVVTIYSVDEIRGEPYIAMEYVSGISLQQRLKEGPPLEINQIVRIGMEIADGLAAAHAQGVIHRDVKPSNILLEGENKQVKLTDFGLACAIMDGSITGSNEVMGTPLYMAPEQIQSDTFDHRVDLFSLGSVLYAMCTGQPAFRAANQLAITRRVCDDTPRPISELRPSIPAWLDEMIARLMEKDAAARYQSASEVAQYLRQQLEDLSPVTDETPATVTFATKSRRLMRRALRAPNWSVKTAVAACAAALVLALGATELAGVTQITPTIIQIVRGDGTLVVEVDDPAVKVSIDDGDVVISGAGLNEVRLRPGKHELRATRNDVLFQKEEVVISRGGRQSVRVAWNPSDTARVTDPDLLARRNAAEWVLSVGGKVQIVMFGVFANVADVNDLPLRDFRAETVYLTGNKQVNDKNIQKLTALKGLHELFLKDTSITDAALKHLAKLTQLESLTVTGTNVTDAGLVQLKAFHNLQRLNLAFTQTTDEGAKHLSRLGSLINLNLKHTQVADAGMAHLAKLKNLQILHLVDTRITDKSIRYFKQLKALKELTVGDTGISEDGFAALKRTLPNCKVRHRL